MFDASHRKRGMQNGLAYHFVIGNGTDTQDRQIEMGSRWLKQLQGGHVKNHYINEVGIGICLVGNFENNPRQDSSNPDRFNRLASRIGPQKTGEICRP